MQKVQKIKDKAKVGIKAKAKAVPREALFKCF